MAGHCSCCGCCLLLLHDCCRGCFVFIAASEELGGAEINAWGGRLFVSSVALALFLNAFRRFCSDCISSCVAASSFSMPLLLPPLFFLLQLLLINCASCCCEKLLLQPQLRCRTTICSVVVFLRATIIDKTHERILDFHFSVKLMRHKERIKMKRCNNSN